MQYLGDFSIIPGTSLDQVRDILHEIEGRYIIVKLSTEKETAFSYTEGNLVGHSLFEKHMFPIRYLERKNIDREIANIVAYDRKGNPCGPKYHHCTIKFSEQIDTTDALERVVSIISGLTRNERVN